MSTVMTQNARRTRDHFEPEDLDPQEQRRIRGQLEQIDYTAFLANREVIAPVVGEVRAEDFTLLAARIAQSRARWVSEALRLARSASAPTPEQIATLTHARAAYEELGEAYEGLRRLVERGHVPARFGSSG